MTDEERDRIRKYVMGDLPEEVREVVEARLMSDEGFLSEVEDVEDELVEDFVRGALPADEAARFARRVEALPALGASVLRARLMREALGARTEEAAGGTGTALSGWRGHTARPSSFGLRLAMAAGLLAVLVAAAVVLRTATPSSEKRGTRTAEGGQPPAAAPVSKETVPGATVPGATPRAGGPHDRKPGEHAGEQRTAASGGGTMVVLALLPGQTMGPDSGAELVLAPGVERVRLELGLDEAAHARYVAELVSDEDRVVWRGSRLSSQAAPSGPTVRVDLPAALLVRPAYRLVLIGEGEGGTREAAGTYFFRTTRP